MLKDVDFNPHIQSMRKMLEKNYPKHNTRTFKDYEKSIDEFEQWVNGGGHVSTGIYIGIWNFGNEVPEDQLVLSEDGSRYDQDFFRFDLDKYLEYINGGSEYEDKRHQLNYGVCDSIEQCLEYFRDILEDPDHNFAIGFWELNKSEEEPGGWRWHKWGPYIGTQDPQCEYLYDEPVIETVFLYHTVELK